MENELLRQWQKLIGRFAPKPNMITMDVVKIRKSDVTMEDIEIEHSIRITKQKLGIHPFQTP